MAKIKHIALSTQDVDKTAKFYIDVFGMKEIARIDSPGARGYYLSDGDLNLAILNFKNDAVAGVERGKGWSGIHHIGFQVESLEAIAERLAAAGSEPRHDINEALGVGYGREPHGNVEIKYIGPDGVTVDVSETDGRHLRLQRLASSGRWTTAWARARTRYPSAIGSPSSPLSSCSSSRPRPGCPSCGRACGMTT
jgi:catechol 2,3-dioxygenase-like lactoylglutathione lyase family enzyme